MANDLNRWQGIGRLGKDPEVRYLPDGRAVASFSVACGSSWKDKQSGEKKESTEWVNISAFGQLAEIMGKYLKKGSRIFVEGRLKTDKYQKDGQDHYSTKVIADSMQMLDSKSDTSASPSSMAASSTHSAPTAPAAVFDDFDDDIPF